MAWNIATVATGSTADINEPNAKLSTKFTAEMKEKQKKLASYVSVF